MVGRAPGDSARACVLLLLSCLACGTGALPPPATNPSPAQAPASTPLVADQARCAADFEQARRFANDGDRSVHRNINAAIGSYERAVATYPRDPQTLWKLALAYAKTEEWASMCTVLERASVLEPNFTPLWLQLGKAWVQRAEAGEVDGYERAIGPLRNCVAQDPNLSDCHFLLGEAYAATGEARGALEAYTKAVETNPAMGKHFVALAGHYRMLGFESQAKAVCIEGVRLVEPTEQQRLALYDLHLLLASIAQSEGDRPTTLRALEDAEKYASEGHPEHAFLLGSMYGTASPPEKKRAMRLLTVFQKRTCRGALAAKFQEQCEMSNELLERLGP